MHRKVLATRPPSLEAEIKRRTMCSKFLGSPFPAVTVTEALIKNGWMPTFRTGNLLAIANIIRLQTLKSPLPQDSAVL